MIEKSYVMVKPGFANDEKIIDAIKAIFKSVRLEIVEDGFVRYDKESAAKHYCEHVEKPFYPELEEYITSDKAFGMIVEGEDAIKTIRKVVGKTDGSEKGTIRNSFPKIFGVQADKTKNIVHASDSVENAEKEIKIFQGLRKSYSKDNDLSK